LANKSKQTFDISSRVDTKHPQVVHSGQLTRWLSNFAKLFGGSFGFVYGNLSTILVCLL
jgi:hypothetical protein